jgi:hypothetical protein
MKSLVLKDLYNIGHNVKSMVFILLVFACIFIPSLGAEAYIIMSGVLCSMMVSTTFGFDNNSKWTKYAMVTPITKKELVGSKFAVLLIFSAGGAVSGLVIGSIGGILTHKVMIGNIRDVLTLLLTGLLSLVIAEIIGGTSIPLLFQFGAEKARMAAFASIAIPFAVFFGIYAILALLGVSFSDNLIFILICLSPLIALVWNLVMYRISYAVFEKKELLY